LHLPVEDAAQLLGAQRAIYAATPPALAGRQACSAFDLIALNHLGYRGVAQSNLGGNLRPRSSPLVCSNHLPASFVLRGWTELPCIVFFHARIFAENPPAINLFVGRINSCCCFSPEERINET
jgi:hypothetical protein